MLEAMSEKGSEDVKAKFREALERKNRQHHDSVSSDRPDESSHGETDTHAHGTKREFRRKSG